MTERTTVELDQKTMATLSAVATATLTTVLLKKGLRNVWLRGTKPLVPARSALSARLSRCALSPRAKIWPRRNPGALPSRLALRSKPWRRAALQS